MAKQSRPKKGDRTQLKKCLKEGAILRATRDRSIADERLSLEEEALIRKGEEQLNRGQYVRWEDIKKT
jgi:hypothetical protein